MRFLRDENQSPLIVELLVRAGHEATHVRDVGLGSVLDAEILTFAAERGMLIVSADTDFGDLLAQTNADSPSVVLLRRQSDRRASEIAALVLANLGSVADDLDAGAIVVFDEDRIRIRRLPMRPE